MLFDKSDLLAFGGRFKTEKVLGESPRNVPLTITALRTSGAKTGHRDCRVAITMSYESHTGFLTTIQTNVILIFEGRTIRIEEVPENRLRDRILNRYGFMS